MLGFPSKFVLPSQNYEFREEHKESGFGPVDPRKSRIQEMEVLGSRYMEKSPFSCPRLVGQPSLVFRASALGRLVPEDVHILPFVIDRETPLNLFTAHNRLNIVGVGVPFQFCPENTIYVLARCPQTDHYPRCHPLLHEQRRHIQSSCSFPRWADSILAIWGAGVLTAICICCLLLPPFLLPHYHYGAAEVFQKLLKNLR